MEIGKVFSILNREMRKELSIHDHEYWPKSVPESQQCTIKDAEEHVAELVEVVVKDLA